MQKETEQKNRKVHIPDIKVGGLLKALIPQDLNRIWKILTILFITLSILIIASSVWIFISVTQNKFFVSRETTGGAPEAIDRSILREVVTLLEERREQFAQLKEVRPSIIDPSR